MYPEPITLAELTHERTVASSEFGEQDRIRRAVRDLIAGGLLYLMEHRIAAGETPVDPLVFGDHNGKPFQAATIYRRADRA